jgi:type IV secretion system protein VirD4
VFFGCNDFSTAEYVSNRLGEATIAVQSGGTSTGGSRQSSDTDPGTSVSASWNDNSNWNQVARKLLKPEEVMALNPRIAITFAPGVPPVWTFLLRYFEERLGGPSRWAKFWTGFKIAGKATACFFAATLLALLVTAGAVQKSQVPSNWSTK